MSSIYDPRVIKHEVTKERAYYALTGGVINDHFWNALTIRRDLNPARFDHHHPNAAEFFELRPPIMTLPQPILFPPILPSPTTPPPATAPPESGCPGLPPQAGPGVVPEPSSVILLALPLIFVGLVLWLRKTP